jgi:hypothetical protein
MRITKLLPLPIVALASIAHADPPPNSLPPPMLAHLELVDGKQHTDYAVFIGSDGKGSELKVDSPGQLATRVNFELRRSPEGPALAFWVEHVGPDKSSYAARGEIALPPVGKKVLAARVPRGDASVDVLLSLTAAK